MADTSIIVDGKTILIKDLTELEATSALPTNSVSLPFWSENDGEFQTIDLKQLVLNIQTTLQETLISYINSHSTITSDGQGGYVLHIS